MNERLQHLAREAGHFEFNKWDYFDINKFAELIVQECMTTVLKESKWYWDKDEFESANAVQNAARRVKEHFGVEE
jgi:hypothetical protein